MKIGSGSVFKFQLGSNSIVMIFDILLIFEHVLSDSTDYGTTKSSCFDDLVL